MINDDLRGQTGSNDDNKSNIPETATTRSTTETSEDSLRAERIRFIYNRLTTQDQHIDRLSKYQLFLSLLVMIDLLLTLVIAYTIFL